MFLAKSVEAGEFFGVDIRAGGIVGMDEKNGTGARREGAFERLEIDEPAMGVGEGVGGEADVLKTG